MSAGLQGRAITVDAGPRRLLDNVDIDVLPGIMTAIVGPNGAGKTTLLRVLAGDIVPHSGQVLLNGKPLVAWTSRARARQRAVLPQSPELAFSFRAWDLVELGRYPLRGVSTLEQDHAAVQDAMRATQTTNFAARDCRSLSDGERHRVHCSRALAQLWAPSPPDHARLLLLDEPTTGLDLFHQHTILAKTRKLAHAGVGILAVLHDLNLAAAYADIVVVLAGGRAETSGSPAKVFTEERIARLWGVQCEVGRKQTGRVQIAVRPMLSRDELKCQSRRIVRNGRAQARSA